MHKPDPVEIIAVSVPLLAEALAVGLFIVMIGVWIVIGAGA